MPEHIKSALGYVALFLGVYLVLTLISYAFIPPTADNSEFNDWARKCYAQEGVLAVTHIQDDGREWYECFVDGKEVSIP